MRIGVRDWVVSLGAAALVALTAQPPTAQLIKFNIDDDNLAPLSPAMQREIAGLHYLLNPYQLRQFFELDTDDDRMEWIQRWWRSQDPTPATALNEMRIEHDQRVRAARLEFGWKEWPGWDHRGEVLIRYGNPDFRRNLDWIVTPAGAVPPGESWEYFQHDMTVIFEDRTHNGKYTLAFRSRGNRDTRRISGAPPPFETSADAGKPIDADFDGPRGYPVVPPTNWYFVYLSDKAQQRVNNLQGVLEDYPSTYPFNFDRSEMPFYYGVGQFKGGGPLNRVEVNVELQAAPPPLLLAGETQKFDVTATFFDSEFRQLDRKSAKISLPAAALPESGELWYPVQLVFSLEENYYRVAVTVEEKGSERSSSYRSTFSAGDFRHQTAISDVLFCSKITPADEESPFNRGPLEVVPHPRGTYRVSAPVPVYFELYNLDVDDDGLSSYALEYWVVPFDKRSGSSDDYAVSRFESSSYGSDAPIDVSLDTAGLAAGRHVFHVKVTDLRTLFTFERAAAFQLVD